MLIKHSYFKIFKSLKGIPAADVYRFAQSKKLRAKPRSVL